MQAAASAAKVRAAAAAGAPYPYAPFAPPAYPATATIDNSTHGAWRDAGYGSHGFVLLGFRDGAVDYASLPGYVAAVNCSSPRTLDSAGSAGEAGLQDPTDPHGAPRRLGAAVATALYSLAVDVVLLPGAAPPVVNLSVYVTGCGGQESVVLHVEDLETRNPLVPDVTLRAAAPGPAWGGQPSSFNAGGLWGLQHGVYLRVPVTRSARIKAYCVGGTAGCAASVSAVFFDPAA